MGVIYYKLIWVLSDLLNLFLAFERYYHAHFLSRRHYVFLKLFLFARDVSRLHGKSRYWKPVQVPKAKLHLLVCVHFCYANLHFIACDVEFFSLYDVKKCIDEKKMVGGVQRIDVGPK